MSRWRRFFARASTPPTVPYTKAPVFDVPTLRLQALVRHRFADPDAALAALRGIPHDEYRGQDPERVQAALVLLSEGSPDRLQEGLALLKKDCRDVLVWGGLGNADWPTRLEEALSEHR
jgi:hypothetical protein